MVLQRVTQSWHVLSPEAPSLMLCHNPVGSRRRCSFDPLWAAGWHEQCSLCPGSCVAQAQLELGVCWRVFMLSIYWEAVVFMELSTRCFLWGTLWSSLSRQLGGFFVLPQVMVLKECSILVLFLLFKTFLWCSNSAT